MWGEVPITKMKAAAIRPWMQAPPLAPLSQGHIRSIMYELFDLAMLWDYIAVERNSMELVTLREVTKRVAASTILTPAQVQLLLAELFTLQLTLVCFTTGPDHIRTHAELSMQ